MAGIEGKGTGNSSSRGWTQEAQKEEATFLLGCRGHGWWGKFGNNSNERMNNCAAGRWG